ncbi:liprin-beta-2b isoform X3 [Hemibagrus wyckioides]|uniref:liprin-beta-2b isoform X3 n=1 Tax=Hemibagrus wyckioides TaxID=337641 RepID=UPI00266CFC9C|nr:liprin-beta-2b isoform X3 [Hemibagrus wyckioides]
MASDASHVLEAALEQMDDIIAGSKVMVEFTNGLPELGSPVSVGPLQVLQLAEELRLALELQGGEGRGTLRSQLPCSTAQTLLEWLDKGVASQVNRQPCSNNETYQERLERLEGDKESLVLQVSVLTEQVEAQGEKIRDLEASLEEHHHKLISTEEMLQQELLNRTSLETQKLDLMDEVSYLKLKLVSMEEDHNHTDKDDKQHKAECVVNVISELQAQMRKFQQEITTRIQEQRALEGHPESPAPDADLCSSDTEDYGRSQASGGDNALEHELRALKAKVDDLENEKSQYERKLKATKTEITELQQILSSKDAEIESLQNQLLSRGNGSSDGVDRDLEMQRLKIGMESLLAANDEKDRHIEELTALLGQYRKCKDMMVLSQVCGDRLLCGSSDEDLSGRMRALPHKAHSDIVRSELQMSSSRGTPQLLLPSMCLQNDLDSRSTLRMLSSSLEELQSGSKHRHVMGQAVAPNLENRLISDSSKYQTLPGKLSRPEQNGERDRLSSPLQLSPDESEESEINLTKSEKMDESTLSDVSPLSSGMDSGQQSPVSPDNRKNQKGIRKLWGKIRRTQSGGLPADGVDDFKRGGVRSTAGPRLAGVGNRDSAREMNNTPFSKWSCDQVCAWLEDYGLGQYVPMASQWVSSGQTLLSASLHDFEKELGIKHPLHRKKLQLAVHSLTTRQSEKSAELDHIWVTRWLDDIGLPQYKDQFHEGRVDGRMLQYLTVNDLLILKVTSQLHHLSIKCAIHVLYVNKFNPNCLKRRPGDEMLTSPSEVVQWSNHRVMEWLRSVDLAEYAPNLRGSGVHGGLIILEPRFNSDTLAMLLNIPPQKTLLRRHLNTNFNSLVGAQAQLEKQEYMESQSYTPLSTTAKVRPKKIGFSNFSQLRKKRPDDPSDLICPLEAPKVLALLGDSQRPSLGVQEREPERREQMQITKGAVMQIEALSEGINHLTHLLSRDVLLRGMRRSHTAMV